MAHKPQFTESVTDILTTFWCPRDLFLNRPTATWNLFVLHSKEAKIVNGDIVNLSVLQ